MKGRSFMKINKTKVLKVLCVVGYGLFIGVQLMQAFDLFVGNAVLVSIGKCGLGFGAATMLIYLLNKDGRICALKKKIFEK